MTLLKVKQPSHRGHLRLSCTLDIYIMIHHEEAMQIILWLGSLNHKELYEMVATLGSLKKHWFIYVIGGVTSAFTHQTFCRLFILFFTFSLFLRISYMYTIKDIIHPP